MSQRRPPSRPRRRLRVPEYRALEQIVADAQAEGRAVLVLGPVGIFEIVGSVTNTDPALLAGAKVTDGKDERGIATDRTEAGRQRF